MQKQKLKIPWKHIFTSVPMWAIIIAHCGQNWGYWMLLTEIPSYLNGVLKFDIQKVQQFCNICYQLCYRGNLQWKIVSERSVISVTISGNVDTEFSIELHSRLCFEERRFARNDTQSLQHDCSLGTSCDALYSGCDSNRQYCCTNGIAHRSSSAQCRLAMWLSSQSH